MDRLTRATVLAVAALLVLPAAAVAAEEPPPATASAGMASFVAEAGAEVVFRALSLLGVNYRFGGNTPDTGLDCSGLVRLVFHETLGLPLPRRSEEISRVGGAVAPAELQPGDLVFFNTLRRAFSHVGIYIGNNQFVHAPSSGGMIRVENLGADYWVRRFDGARRLLASDATSGASVRTAGAPVLPAVGPTVVPVAPAAATAVAPVAPAPAASIASPTPAVGALAAVATVTPRGSAGTPSMRRAAASKASLVRAAPVTGAARRPAARVQPVAVAAKAGNGAPLGRAGPRGRVPDLYVN